MKQQRRQKGRKKPTRKEEKCMQCIYILHSGLNYMKKIRKSQQSIDLKHTDAESQKWYEKTLYKNIGKM